MTTSAAIKTTTADSADSVECGAAAASADDSDPCSCTTTPEDDEADQSSLLVVVDPPDPERESHAVDWEPFKHKLQRLTELLGVTAGEIVVRIVRDDEMSSLHERFCGDPTTTDVLTFDMDQLASDDRRTEADRLVDDADDLMRRANRLQRLHIEVSLAVCLDEAVRQADDRNHDVMSELLLYAVHGLLHCLGHDDHDSEAYDEMHAVEDELLGRLGIGPVFSRQRRSIDEDKPT